MGLSFSKGGMFTLPSLKWRQNNDNPDSQMKLLPTLRDNEKNKKNMILKPHRTRLLKIVLFLLLFLVIVVNLAEFLKQYVRPSIGVMSGHGKGSLFTVPVLRLLGSDPGFIRVGHLSVDLVTSTMIFTDPLWVANPAAAAAAAAEAAAQGEEDEVGDGSYLRATFPSSIKDFSKETKDCGPSDNFETTASICRLFGEHVQLKVTESKKANHITCYHIVWAALSKDFIPYNCFELDEAYWYGGPELPRQMYPIEKSSIPMVPYVPGFDSTIIHNNLSVSPILERYWINSQGTGIVVDNLIPLHVSMNHSYNSKLCFKAEYDNSPYANPENNLPSLSYSVCKASNVKNLHEYLRKRWFENPIESPIEMLGQPLWTTGEFFGNSIDQTKFLTYTDKIVKFGFLNSQVQLDSYSPLSGDIMISPMKFPNSKQMIDEIKATNLRVRIKMCACSNLRVQHFREGKEQSYWLMNNSSQKVAITLSRLETVAMLDFTNPEARKWFSEKIIFMKNSYGIQSFTFDLANIYALPFHFLSNIPMKNPSEYLTKLAEFAYATDHQAIIRGGFQSQKVPLFVEAYVKNATWDYNSGLKNVIPSVLTLGILGYPFILPSAIGGSNGTNSPPASKELFIRWAEMATYFPIMHFSIPPWFFDEETVRITQSLLKIHQRNVVPLLKHLMKEAEVTGAPIIRPIWWIAPEDPIALRIDCEFLLGDNLLVAPILDPGHTSRNIYLPRGHWTDVINNKKLEGGRWYKDYKIQLHQIATFQKLKPVL